ncbi:MAG: prolyl oligopeptidase family serine peptidase [Steroidobacteraceae bacterium]|nr:prolyl oligopeptidase family serine peptidase [Steroidobacteraceae bacterium]
MIRLRNVLIALCGGLALAACNGDDGDEAALTPGDGGMPQPGAPPPGTPQPGTLLEAPALVKSYTVNDLLAALSSGEATQFIADLITSPVCGVDVYQIRYQTVGASSEPTTASGALMVPTGADASCQGARSIVLYAHGTSTDRAFNIANLQSSTEGAAIGAMFAANGYLVVAPNYAGYDTSSLPYHPYLLADQQAKDMTDALTAARSALPVSSAPTIVDDGKLFITGYSQGGYVAMATHRAMQAVGTTVTASAPLSGPYALAAFGDAIFQGRVNGDAPVNLTMLVTAYQRAYGDIYTNPTDVFEARYATGIETLLPNTVGIGDLVSQGKLAENALFSTTPPAPEFAPLTPATEPAELAPVFALGFGPDNLITNNYRLAYLQDTQVAPDGGFPTVTDGLPPANPSQTLRRALRANDLRNWTPNAPVLLCGGGNDPTVFFFNTELMQSYWTANPPAAPVTVVNIDSSGEPYSDLRDSFAAAKDSVRVGAVVSGEDEDEAVLKAYHAGLVSPFCLAAAKRFFDGL